MACARPLVASELAGIAAAVADGESGLLVPPGDAAALAAAIERLLDEPELRRRLGSRARSRVERDFDLGVVHEALPARDREGLCRWLTEARRRRLPRDPSHTC